MEICPPPETYAPCYCGPTTMEYGTLILECSRCNLTDSEVSDILDAFLSTPGVSPLLILNLSGNQLTRVPSQMQLFTELVVIEFQNNAIPSIESGTFNSNDDNWSLYLDSNQLTTIAPSAFRGWLSQLF